MAGFRVTIADEAGRKLYDKMIEAADAPQACERAGIDKNDMESSSVLGMGVLGKMRLGQPYEPRDFVIEDLQAGDKPDQP